MIQLIISNSTNQPISRTLRDLTIAKLDRTKFEDNLVTLKCFQILTEAIGDLRDIETRPNWALTLQITTWNGETIHSLLGYPTFIINELSQAIEITKEYDTEHRVQTFQKIYIRDINYITLF